MKPKKLFIVTVLVFGLFGIFISHGQFFQDIDGKREWVNIKKVYSKKIAKLTIDNFVYYVPLDKYVKSIPDNNIDSRVQKDIEELRNKLAKLKINNDTIFLDSLIVPSNCSTFLLKTTKKFFYNQIDSGKVNLYNSTWEQVDGCFVVKFQSITGSSGLAGRKFYLKNSEKPFIEIVDAHYTLREK